MLIYCNIINNRSALAENKTFFFSILAMDEKNDIMVRLFVKQPFISLISQKYFYSADVSKWQMEVWPVFC